MISGKTPRVILASIIRLSQTTILIGDGSKGYYYKCCTYRNFDILPSVSLNSLNLLISVSHRDFIDDGYVVDCCPIRFFATKGGTRKVFAATRLSPNNKQPYAIFREAHKFLHSNSRWLYYCRVLALLTWKSKQGTIYAFSTISCYLRCSNLIT